jgi:DNA-binding transcriptional MerR regulator
MTIGQLAKLHGLSRSTLLYYHRLGLLKSSGRLRKGYRHYTTRNDARLRRICLYRRTGLPLAEIGPLLIRPGRQALALILESQLHELSTQIEALRGRERLVVELLQDHRLHEHPRPRRLGETAAGLRVRWPGFGALAPRP